MSREDTLIRQLQGMLGGKSIRDGVAAISIVANNSGSVAVNHGIDGVPTSVVVSTDQLNWFASASGIGANQFTANVREFQAANATLTVNVHWIARG